MPAAARVVEVFARLVRCVAALGVVAVLAGCGGSAAASGVRAGAARETLEQWAGARVLFLVTLFGQAIAGHADFDNQQLAAGAPEVSFGQFLTSAEFAVDTAENWQSEYLQFFLYVFATVWLLQRGSPESKPAHRLGREDDQAQQIGSYAHSGSPPWARAGGWRTAVFSRSLGLVMGGLFLLSWLAQAIAGRSAYNAEQLRDVLLTVLRQKLLPCK